MSRAQNYHPTPLPDQQILHDARFSFDPEEIGLRELPGDVKKTINEERKNGFEPMGITWPNGKFVLLCINPHAPVLDAQVIIQAYRAAETSDKQFPNGDTAWTR